MRNKVCDAVAVARGLLDATSRLDFPVAALVDLARRFAAIEFDTPDAPDADGYLFQHGEASWFSEPAFVLGLVRQLEVEDSSGEHEAYVQVQFEFRYPLDDDLAGAGRHADWWFPGEGKEFEVWLTEVAQSPIVRHVAGKTPRDFQIWQELV
ncbi:hypothetical protein LFM09_01430 [Lentzea alba]|uniref:hypothetical protein n=1 Tax=Lentzea alba TaxID=2714351 RepID=UPI0039BFE8C8